MADIPASSPSLVTIVDRATLAQNLSENAKNVLCQASFGAGAYAIGGRLLGFAPLAPGAALLTAGALVAALTLCPAGASSEKILGVPPGFSGGQCPVIYSVSVRLQWVGATSGIVFAASASRGTRGRGPFQGVKQVTTGRSAVARLTFADRVVDFGGQNFPADEELIITNVVYEVIERDDGLPDNCGNPPRSGGQLIQNPAAGDTIDNTKVTNNTTNNYIVPVLINLGGINGNLNLSFGDINIGSLFPLNFDIDISGTRFRFGEKPDGTLEPKPVFPDPDSPDDQTDQLRRLEKVLKEIKECTCNPPPSIETETALIPVAFRSAEECDQSTVPLEIVKGALTPEKVGVLNESFALAVQGCEFAEPPVQKEEGLIFAASTLIDGRELFTGLIPPEVHSLRMKITSINNDNIPIIKTYPAANQRKFGSIGFVTDGVSGGGDYIYVFDQDTYYPLPRRGKDGRLRILMRAGLSFEVYDTGERVRL